jgi:flagellar export protein FliJ
MRRFRFRLERLLWHRQRQEDLAEQALAQALRGEHDLATELARLRDRSAAEGVSLRAMLHRPTLGLEMALHVRFAAALATRRAILTRRREEAVLLIGERRAALRERRRARETVGKLRERALARYRKAVEREAQAALDETAGLGHTRRAAERTE